MGAANSLETVALASWMCTIKQSALQDMLNIAERPDILSFALGLPAAELFPTDAFAMAARHVLDTDPRALQYQPAYRPLQAHIVTLMEQRGLVCRPEQVFLTAGAQQGMSLLAHLLLNPGSQVLTEQLIYTGFQQAIAPFQPDVLTVPTDLETGIDVDAVAALLAHGARPAFIYTITDGHNPLGVSMHSAKRTRLVELARRYQVPIVEDDAYGFLAYERPEPPLRALDEQWVIYLGSFSKILAPALRVGWLIVPEALIPKLSIIKEASDINTSTFTQRLIAAYLDAGHLPSHLAMLHREYRARRDNMLRALQNYFPDQTRWVKPTNGLFIWVRLPNMVDAGELLTIAVETRAVAFVPGQAFRVGSHRDATDCMRLNFSNCASEYIEEGIARLAQILKSEFPRGV
jgi:2-aminoadipate transaminase